MLQLGLGEPHDYGTYERRRRQDQIPRNLRVFFYHISISTYPPHAMFKDNPEVQLAAKAMPETPSNSWHDTYSVGVG